MALTFLFASQLLELTEIQHRITYEIHKYTLRLAPDITMSKSQETDHAHVLESRCPRHPPQRRSHKKSRNGCQNCKRRRIKVSSSYCYSRHF